MNTAALLLAVACTATSGPQAPTLVELYTSQGCSSCPPADRWLSRLPRDGSVLPLAFHVSYWDYIGWKDPFAQAAFGERQRQQQRINGSRIAYTPQVVLQGQDRRDWSGWRAQPAGAAAVQITLARDGAGVQATLKGAPRRLAAQWWWTSSGHETAVGAGENRGERLRHDHVVRGGLAVQAFDFSGSQQLRLPEAPPGQRVVLVLLDALSGRPLQALALDC
jgi:hypothetical protein